MTEEKIATITKEINDLGWTEVRIMEPPKPESDSFCIAVATRELPTGKTAGIRAGGSSRLRSLQALLVIAKHNAS